jgi:hypothetical protein
MRRSVHPFGGEIKKDRYVAPDRKGSLQELSTEVAIPELMVMILTVTFLNRCLDSMTPS